MSANISIECESNGTNHTLLVNQQAVLELPTADSREAVDIRNAVKGFIEVESLDGDHVEVKGDDGKLGIIVDIWNAATTDCEATCCFWFDDYIERYVR